MAQSIAGRYEIKELIGRGGIGEVYQALDTETGSTVAVKVLKTDVVERDAELVKRFAREGEALRKLNHPNIVKVLDTIEAQGQHSIVMEMVPGGTLADLLKEQPQLPVGQVLQIGLELADALSRAHHLKIIHRDIKPANILLAEDGTPRLTDFGVAHVEGSHMTEAGYVMGTFAYLSPEACRGEVLDVRADIWSYGVVMYEMLTGQRPFTEERPAALINSIMTQPVPSLETLRPDAPIALIDLIYRMLDKNRDARIPRMRMVGAELEAIIDQLDTEKRPVNVGAEAGKSLFETPTADDVPTASASRQLSPTNLPAFPTPFVGRDEELANLASLLSDHDNRLITIIGLGGLGKTRLAVEAGQRARALFSDGVYYVPLAPVNSPVNLVTAIADSVGFTFGGDSPLAELTCYLQEKNILLVLDNVEHLVKHSDILGNILQSASGVTLLATSRERLRLQGEYIFELDPMRLPDSNDPDQMAELPAVQLFLASAHRVAGDFELTPETAPHVADICYLVQGVPLGIELAAAWLEVLPIHEIVREIEQSLDFLETDLRDVPERHRSIRAVFEYSWNLMTDDEREVFMKLSVFRGGFERDAAQAVTGASLRNLMTLVNKSLLRRAPDGRYFPQKLLREYAEERFADWPDSRQVTRNTHAEYYANLLIEHMDAFNSEREQKVIQSLEREIGNFRAAWDWLLETQDWTTLDRMLIPLTFVYQARSMLREGADRFDALAEALAAGSQTQTANYWRARLSQSMLAGRIGDYQQSLHYSQEALAFFAEDTYAYEQSLALNNLSYAAMMLGDYEKSVEYGNRALERAYIAEDSVQIFVAMGNLGYARYLLGDYEAARRIYTEFLGTAQDVSYSPIGKAFAFNNLGEILHAMGDLQQARDLYQRAYDIFKSYDTRRGMAFTLNNLGGLNFMLGNGDEALGQYQTAYQINKEIGDRRGMGHSLSALGNYAMFQGNLDEAHHYYEEALAVRRATGNRRDEADSLGDLGLVAMMQNRIAQANDYLENSLEIRRAIGDRTGEGRILVWMALVHRGGQDEQATRRRLRQARIIGQEIEDKVLLMQTDAGLAELAIQSGDLPTARQHLRELARAFQQTGLADVMHYGVACLAELKLVEGATEDAAMLTAFVREMTPTGLNIGQIKAQEIYARLRNQLSDQKLAEATVQAKSLTVETIVNEILQTETP